MTAALTPPIAHRTLALLAMVVCCAHPSASHGAKKLDGEQILQRTLNLYGSAGYFACQASIEEDIVVYRNSGYLEERFESATVSVAHRASLEYRRPSHFDARWSILNSQEEVQRAGSLVTADALYILGHQYPNNQELAQEPDQYSSLDRAIDHSEFSSYRFTAFLRDFLDPAFHGDLLANEVRLTGTKRLGKLRCYVLKIQGYKSMTLWIDRTNFALCKASYALDYETLQAESAWLEWKLNQAELSLSDDADRIQGRLDLYRDPPQLRPHTVTLVLHSQTIQP